jgi:hypothetical protein
MRAKNLPLKEGAEESPLRESFSPPLPPPPLPRRETAGERVNKNIVFVAAAKSPPQKQFFFYPFSPGGRAHHHFLSNPLKGEEGFGAAALPAAAPNPFFPNRHRMAKIPVSGIISPGGCTICGTIQASSPHPRRPRAEGPSGRGLRRQRRSRWGRGEAEQLPICRSRRTPRIRSRRPPGGADWVNPNSRLNPPIPVGANSL